MKFEAEANRMEQTWRLLASALCDDSNCCWVLAVCSAIPIWKEESTCSNIFRQDCSNAGMTKFSNPERSASWHIMSTLDQHKLFKSEKNLWSLIHYRQSDIMWFYVDVFFIGEHAFLSLVQADMCIYIVCHWGTSSYCCLERTQTN